MDLKQITDPVILEAVKEQIAQFGQTPARLFTSPSPAREPLSTRALKSSRRRMHLVHKHPEELAKASGLCAPPRVGTHIFSKPPCGIACIRCLSNRLFIISTSGRVAVHPWPINRTVEEGFGFQFSEPIEASPCIAGAIQPSSDGRFLFLGNTWDHSLRVYSISEEGTNEARCKLTQNLVFHQARINCIDISSNGSLLVSGSRDGGLLVWDIETTQRKLPGISAVFGESRTFVHQYPRHMLQGHLDGILCVAVQDALQICVSASTGNKKRAHVLVHCLQTGQVLQQLELLEPDELHKELLHKESMRLNRSEKIKSLETHSSRRSG